MSAMTRSPKAPAEAQDSRSCADDQVGVTQIIGYYQDCRGVRRLIAVRRTGRERRDVVELVADEPAQVLHSIYGDSATAAEHALKAAGARLTQAQDLAA